MVPGTLIVSAPSPPLITIRPVGENVPTATPLTITLIAPWAPAERVSTSLPVPPLTTSICLPGFTGSAVRNAGGGGGGGSATSTEIVAAKVLVAPSLSVAV